MSKNREQDSKTANAGATGVVVEENRPPLPGLRQTIFDVIFGHQTAAGLTFDLFLLAAILCSVVVVCLETVSEFGNFQRSFLYAEIGLRCCLPRSTSAGSGAFGGHPGTH